ncbi:MAG TPA: hypothetical protein VL240_09820 [Candidatus Binatia bacterium]|nr:hypothetical protein [Candidatus Binatia bacterium]
MPVFCSSSLRDAGYTLQLAFTADEALRKIHEVGVDIVVFGEGIDSGERTRMEGALQSLRPRPRIIMLYDISIARAEQADAVLNIKGDPQDLVRTIRYLLTGTC